MSEQAPADDRPESAAPPILAFRAVRKAYPGVIALDGAEAEIAAGTVTGLLGKNGAGKSTLIKVAGGVVSPDAGEVLLDGRPVTLDSPHAAAALGVAVVHQELADVPNLTVAENIELGLGYPRRAGLFVNRSALNERAATVLGRLQTEIDPRARVGDLSPAERRLVMIARGLALNARVLVLDEPTAALTVQEIQHLHQVVRALRDHGVAIIYVTHRLQEVFDVTDRVIVMRDGRVVYEDETSNVSRERLIDEITGGHTELEEREEPQRMPAHSEVLMTVDHLSSPGAVEEASFTLRRGEVLGVAGLVGSGRTELLRLIFGADRAASGSVSIGGHEGTIRGPRDAMRAGIALLPEDRRSQGAVAEFSVRKNITLPTLRRFRRLAWLPFPDGRRERRASQELIERLGIKVSDPESPVRHLSGGNQQKVVLAKWLETGADVFLFDEPTHGIDVGAKQEVYRLMTGLAEAGKGVVFVSSEFPELIAICSRVVVMREGRLVAELDGDGLSEPALIRHCYPAAA
ncbi:MAG TPA: sugar ABC transporter ATP-binding protein [Solirubrobacteraceae bacterium]|nr:sugar ABC transporter ATP-binding protein [Solirubrobacteraceae bacterium]